MFFRNIVIVVQTLLFAMTLVSSGVWAKSYKIQLTREAKVGQKYEYTAKGTFFQSVNIAVGSTPIRSQKEDYQIDYQAVVTVLAVSARKQPIRESHKVDHCFKLENGKKDSLIKAGTVVIAERKGEKIVFTINKQPVNPMQAKALNNVINMKKTKDPLDDQIFGSEKPRKVGESWPINAQRAASSLSSKKMSMSAKNIQGKVTLVNVGKVNGHKGLNLRARVNIRHLQIPLPPMFKMVNNNLQIGLAGFFPTDASLDQLRSTKTMRMEFSAKGQKDPKSPPASMDIKVNHALKSTRKYLP